MVSLKFHCQDVKSDFVLIEVNPQKDGLLIEIEEQNKYAVVNLSKSTAIKLSKELRKQISLLTEL